MEKHRKSGFVYRGDEKFDRLLDTLKDKFHRCKGGPEAEVVLSWSKIEEKEDGVLSLYATNSTVSNTIKRCRPGIKAVFYNGIGAEFLISTEACRPLYKVLRVMQ